MVYTDYRPTPLQHYIFPAGGDGLHLVVDDKVGGDTCGDGGAGVDGGGGSNDYG